MNVSLIRCLPLLVLFTAVHAMQPEVDVNPPTPKQQSPDPADVQRAAQLAKLLNSDSYTERMTAQKELFQLGRAAIEPLEYASHSEDSEARLRASEILIALRGRGFMGINLDERDPDEENGTETDDTLRPSFVHVAGVATPEQIGGTHDFPAKLAGIEQDDKIISVNGRHTQGVKDLMREVIESGPAHGALVLLDRKGTKMRLSMVLTRNPMDRFPPVDLEKEIPETKEGNILEKPAKMNEAKPKAEPNKDVKASTIVRDIKKLVQEKKSEETEKASAEVKKKEEKEESKK